jgi:cytochrome c-type biogenesis protein CcmH
MKSLLTMVIGLMVGLTLVFSANTLASSVETYQFSNPDYEVRFHDLNKILRCPKCQNQNLADSNSMISQDLRREVYRLMEEGRSDDQIVEFMVMRYGDFVLYKPKFDDVTYFLWLGPIGFGVLGLLILIVVVIRQRSNKRAAVDVSGNTPGEHLSADEQDKLDKILNRDVS